MTLRSRCGGGQGLAGLIKAQPVVEHCLETAAKGLVLAQNLLGTVIQSQVELQKQVGQVQQSIGGYVDAADARMKQMEANLDALIRIIAAEHKNGHSKT